MFAVKVLILLLVGCQILLQLDAATRVPTRAPTKKPTKQPTPGPTNPTSVPSRQPSTQPSRQPSRQPSSQPSRQPTNQPSRQPSRQPTSQPSMKPSTQPSRRPSMQPSSQPSAYPSCPSSQPSSFPSKPSSQPSTRPSCEPSGQPTRRPTPKPTVIPTIAPSKLPTRSPTHTPTKKPTCAPSPIPTRFPTAKPSYAPSTSSPTHDVSVCEDVASNATCANSYYTLTSDGMCSLIQIPDLYPQDLTMQYDFDSAYSWINEYLYQAVLFNGATIGYDKHGLLGSGSISFDAPNEQYLETTAHFQANTNGLSFSFWFRSDNTEENGRIFDFSSIQGLEKHTIFMSVGNDRINFGVTTSRIAISESLVSYESFGDTNSALENYATAGPYSICSTFTATMCASGGSFVGDTYLRLYDDDKDIEVASDDEGCGGSGGSKIVYTPPSCMTVTLRMGCYRSYSCSGTIAITGATSFSAPSFTPTAAPSIAPTLNPTSSSAIIVSYRASDTNSAQQNYFISEQFAICSTFTATMCGASGASFIGDTYLRLRGSTGIEVASDDDGCGGSGGSKIVYYPPSCMTVTLHMGCFSSRSCEGTVVITGAAVISAGGATIAPTIAPTSLPISAAPTPGPTSLTSVFTVLFTASDTNSAQQNFITAGPYSICSTFTATMCASGGLFSGDTYLRLIGSTGNELWYNDDGCGGSGGSIIVYTPPSCMTVTLRMGCYSSYSCSGTVAISGAFTASPTATPTAAPTATPTATPTNAAPTLSPTSVFTICEDGFQQSGSGSSLTCTKCAANTFAISGNTSCTPCPTNSWSVAGSGFCECNSGYSQSGSGNSMNCSICANDISSSNGTTCSTQKVNGAFNDNVWRHIVWTLSPNGYWSFYVNGILKGSMQGYPYPDDFEGTQNYFGKSSLDFHPYFNGALDDFRVYDRVLAISDVYTISLRSMELFSLGLLNPPEDSRTYSSSFDVGHEYSMLDTGEQDGAWCASNDDTHPYMTIDLGREQTVGGVATQARCSLLFGGRYTPDQFVKTYYVKYSTDGEFFLSATSDKLSQTFYGPQSLPVTSCEEDEKVYQYFNSSIQARYIRIFPMDYNNHICMRAGILLNLFTDEISALVSSQPNVAASTSALNYMKMYFNFDNLDDFGNLGLYIPSSSTGMITKDNLFGASLINGAAIRYGSRGSDDDNDDGNDDNGDDDNYFYNFYLELSYNAPYVKINDPIKTGVEGMSFMFWFKSESGNGCIFDIGNGQSVISVCLVNGGNIKFKVILSGEIFYAQLNVNFDDSMWRHIVWTLSPNGDWNFYVNGILKGAVQGYPYPDNFEGTQNYFGKSSVDSDPYFNGAIDDFRLYDRVLRANDMYPVSYNPSNKTLSILQSDTDQVTISWFPNCVGRIQIGLRETAEAKSFQSPAIISKLEGDITYNFRLLTLYGMSDAMAAPATIKVFSYDTSVTNPSFEENYIDGESRFFCPFGWTCVGTAVARYTGSMWGAGKGVEGSGMYFINLPNLNPLRLNSMINVSENTCIRISYAGRSGLNADSALTGMSVFLNNVQVALQLLTLEWTLYTTEMFCYDENTQVELSFKRTRESCTGVCTSQLDLVKVMTSSNPPYCDSLTAVAQTPVVTGTREVTLSWTPNCKVQDLYQTSSGVDSMRLIGPFTSPLVIRDLTLGNNYSWSDGRNVVPDLCFQDESHSYINSLYDITSLPTVEPTVSAVPTNSYKPTDSPVESPSYTPTFQPSDEIDDSCFIPGWFINENENENGLCTKCPKDYYAPTISAKSCIRCPANSFSVEGSISCQCNPGYSQTGSKGLLACSKCSENTYSDNTICPVDMEYFKGVYDSYNADICYKVISKSSNYKDALKYCFDTYGGSLINVNSMQVSDWVKEKIRDSGRSYWIGLNDIVTEGTYQWQHGSAGCTSEWCYNFNTGEPNDFQGSEDCIEVAYPWWGGNRVIWNDNNCFASQNYICESSPIQRCEPCPTGKLSAAGSIECVDPGTATIEPLTSTSVCTNGFKYTEPESQITEQISSYNCSICPVDTFAINGDVSCTKCPDNSRSVEGSGSCQCKPGYSQSGIGRGLICSKCEENSFSVATTCPPGYTFYASTGSCYLLYKGENSVRLGTGGLTYDRAKKYCNGKQSGYVSVINTQTEMDLLISLMGGNFWIGLDDIINEGEFTWLHGSSPYIPWHPGEPNGGFTENCVVSMGPSYEWKDAICDLESNFVCEVDPISTCVSVSSLSTCGDMPPVVSNLVGYYNSKSWDGKAWKDLSGGRNDVVDIGGDVKIDSFGSLGFFALTGTNTSTLRWPSNILPPTYTLFHLTKYNGRNRRRILSSLADRNWLSGHYWDNIGVAFHGPGWTTSNNSNDIVDNKDRWVLSTDQNNLYRFQGTDKTLRNFGGSSTTSANLAINLWRNADWNHASDWAIASLLVYNRLLTSEEIQRVEGWLYATYFNEDALLGKADSLFPTCRPLCRDGYAGFSCSKCIAGKFAISGDLECTSCPANSNSVEGSGTCQCNPGYVYGLSVNGKTLGCNRCSSDPLYGENSFSNAATCPPGYRYYASTGSCYKKMLSGDYVNASKRCNDDNNGYLVTINNFEENQIVAGICSESTSNNKCWLGSNDVEIEGEFTWLHGSSFYNYWADFEPSNNLGEDCVRMINDDGHWEDTGCKVVSDFICEADPIKNCAKCESGKVSYGSGLGCMTPNVPTTSPSAVPTISSLSSGLYRFGTKDTMSATQNVKKVGPFHVCSIFQASVCDGVASFEGDTFLRIYNDSNKLLMINNDFCGKGSKIVYYPRSCTNVYLHMGCFGMSTCTGNVVVTYDDVITSKPTLQPSTSARPSISSIPTMHPTASVMPTTSLNPSASPTDAPVTSKPTKATSVSIPQCYASSNQCTSGGIDCTEKGCYLTEDCGECMECDPGTAWTNGILQPKGYENKEYAYKECPICLPGFFAEGSSNKECKVCPANSFSDYKSETCLCDPGYVSSGNGNTLVCVRPPTSQPSSRPSPGPTPTPTRLPSLVPTLNPTTANPTGFPSSIPTSSPTNCWSFLKCELGSYHDNDCSKCISCPKGTYSNNSHAYIGDPKKEFCLPCPKDTYSSKSGSSSCRPCPLYSSTPSISSTTCRCDSKVISRGSGDSLFCYPFPTMSPTVPGYIDPTPEPTSIPTLQPTKKISVNDANYTVSIEISGIASEVWGVDPQLKADLLSALKSGVKWKSSVNIEFISANDPTSDKTSRRLQSTLRSQEITSIDTSYEVSIAVDDHEVVSDKNMVKVSMDIEATAITVVYVKITTADVYSIDTVLSDIQTSIDDSSLLTQLQSTPSFQQYPISISNLAYVPDESTLNTKSESDTSFVYTSTGKIITGVAGFVLLIILSYIFWERIKSVLDTAVEIFLEAVSGAELYKDKIDNLDLVRFGIKGPLLALHVVFFFVAFFLFFYSSYQEAATLEYLSPKVPTEPDSPDCRSDSITVNGNFVIDRNGTWEGQVGYSPDSFSYEVRFANARLNYDTWSAIIDTFQADLARVEEMARKLRNNERDMAFDMLIPSSYNLNYPLDVGSVDIYLKGEAGTIFNGKYSRPSIVGAVDKRFDLSNISPAKTKEVGITSVSDVSVAYTNNKIVLTVPTLNLCSKKYDGFDGYDIVGAIDGGICTLPSSTYFKDIYYESQDWSPVPLEEKFDYAPAFTLTYNIESVTTALAINKGLATIDGLSMIGESNGLRAFIDPYYPDMDPVYCFSNRDVVNVCKEKDIMEDGFGKVSLEKECSNVVEEEVPSSLERHYCFLKVTLATVDTFYSIPFMTEKGSYTMAPDDVNDQGIHEERVRESDWYPSYKTRYGYQNLDSPMFKQKSFKTRLVLGFASFKFERWEIPFYMKRNHLFNFDEEEISDKKARDMLFESVSSMIEVEKHVSPTNGYNGVNPDLYLSFRVSDVCPSSSLAFNTFINDISYTKEECKTELSDFISVNENLQYRISETQLTYGKSKPSSNSANPFSNLLKQTFSTSFPKTQNKTIGFIAAVEFDIDNIFISPGVERNETMIGRPTFVKALDGMKARTPIILTQSFQTCKKSKTNAFIDAFGIAFSNTKTVTELFIMILIFFSYKAINKFFTKDPERKAVSPEVKAVIFKMATSLALQKLFARQRFLHSSNDINEDIELQKIIHVVHLLDNMDDKDETYEYLKQTLEHEGIEVNTDFEFLIPGVDYLKDDGARACLPTNVTDKAGKNVTFIRAKATYDENDKASAMKGKYIMKVAPDPLPAGKHVDHNGFLVNDDEAEGDRTVSNNTVAIYVKDDNTELDSDMNSSIGKTSDDVNINSNNSSSNIASSNFSSSINGSSISVGIGSGISRNSVGASNNDDVISKLTALENRFLRMEETNFQLSSQAREYESKLAAQSALIASYDAVFVKLQADMASSSKTGANMPLTTSTSEEDKANNSSLATSSESNIDVRSSSSPIDEAVITSTGQESETQIAYPKSDLVSSRLADLQQQINALTALITDARNNTSSLDDTVSSTEEARETGAENASEEANEVVQSQMKSSSRSHGALGGGIGAFALQSDLASVRANIVELEGKLNDHEAKLKSVSHSVTLMQADITSSSSSSSSIDSKVSSSDVERMTSHDIVTLKADLAAAVDTLASLSIQVKDYESAITSVAGDVSLIQADIASKNEFLAALESSLSGLETKTTTDFVGLSSKIEDLKAIINTEKVDDGFENLDEQANNQADENENENEIETAVDIEGLSNVVAEDKSTAITEDESEKTDDFIDDRQQTSAEGVLDLASTRSEKKKKKNKKKKNASEDMPNAFETNIPAATDGDGYDGVNTSGNDGGVEIGSENIDDLMDSVGADASIFESESSNTNEVEGDSDVTSHIDQNIMDDEDNSDNVEVADPDSSDPPDATSSLTSDLTLDSTATLANTLTFTAPASPLSAVVSSSVSAALSFKKLRFRNKPTGSASNSNGASSSNPDTASSSANSAVEEGADQTEKSSNSSTKSSKWKDLPKYKVKNEDEEEEDE